MGEVWAVNASPVIVLAKAPLASDVLRAIRAAGFYLDDRTIRLALGRIGETW